MAHGWTAPLCGGIPRSVRAWWCAALIYAGSALMGGMAKLDCPAHRGCGGGGTRVLVLINR